MTTKYIVSLSDEVSVSKLKKILRQAFPSIEIDVQNRNVYCYNCNKTINETEDEEVFFDADGQPLCEGCYHESFNDIKEKQVEKIYEYCKDKGISIDELKIH